jgi:hypothetical protein
MEESQKIPEESQMESPKKITTVDVVETKAVYYLQNQTKLLIEVSIDMEGDETKEATTEMEVEEANVRFQEMVQRNFDSELKTAIELVTPRLDEDIKKDLFDQFARKIALTIFKILFEKKHNRPPTIHETFGAHCEMMQMDVDAANSSRELVESNDSEDNTQNESN